MGLHDTIVVRFDGGGFAGLVHDTEWQRCIANTRQCRTRDTMIVALQTMVLGFGFGAAIVLFVYLG